MNYKEFVKEAEKLGYKRMKMNVFANEVLMPGKIVFHFEHNLANGHVVSNSIYYTDVQEMGYNKTLSVMKSRYEECAGDKP